ncbi:hypothetical protein D9615_009930 [Tricholomella constricta]|uniref:Xylose isomerase-like TIM barrel domain-containing protein n=1 Tax=Tricholomella constricta TaxID=117010 RepID=A0A8H5GZH7_9AGAR|nr:hypothetical protein D9615_009930 [Tricholomella constricta]
MHLNDSKTAHNSKKDRHESIGIGHIGIHAFHHIMNDPRVQHIPLVLETSSFELPQETWANEIEVLNQLSGLALDPGATTQSDDLVKGIRTALQHAENASGKGKSKAKAPSRTSRKRKAKADEDDEADEDED